MSNSPNHSSRRVRWRAPKSTLTICAGVAALLFAGSLAAMSIASVASSTTTIGAASNSGLGRSVLVDSQGRTLYALSPETASHLLCTSSACAKVWPPLTVASHTTKLRDAMGVQGRLSTVRRSNGTLQVTFDGMPLYTYAGDRAQGQANGQGLRSFGGTWHVLSPSSASASTPTKPVAEKHEEPAKQSEAQSSKQSEAQSW